MTAFYAIAILVLLGGSAFFSASEMALSGSNRMRLEGLAEEGNRGAVIACKLLDKFDDALSAILIGNNLCNIGSDSLATLLAMAIVGAKYNGVHAIITTIAMTVIVIIFCESAPKILAKKHATQWSVALAGIINALRLILWPLIFVVTILIRLLTLPFKGETVEESEEVAAAELQSTIETAEDEGVIDEDQSELLISALEFSEVPVMDVMTARVDVQALDVEDDWRELVLQGEESEIYSRIPVYEDSIDNIIGILPLNRFYRSLLEDPEPDVRDILIKPLYIYKTVKLPEVLNQLRRNQQHMAIVTDEYGGMLGVVTLEDVLEQIVGEIWDENDVVEEDVVERPDGVFELDGDLPISDFAELFEMKEEALETDSATAGGWTIEKCGAFPKNGEVVEANGIRVTVLQMDEDGLRVEKILAESLKQDENS